MCYRCSLQVLTVENPVPHTLGYVLLHYELIIDMPSTLKVEISSTHIDIGL